MYRHGALQHVIRHSGVHYVQDAMDGLIAADTEDGGADDALRLRVHDHFHEALRFVPFDSASDAVHPATADEQFATAGAGFGLGHANAAERRIDVKGVTQDTLAHLA